MTTGTAVHGTGVYIIQEERRKREEQAVHGREKGRKERTSGKLERARESRKDLPLPGWRKG